MWTIATAKLYCSISKFLNSKGNEIEYLQNTVYFSKVLVRMLNFLRKGDLNIGTRQVNKLIIRGAREFTLLIVVGLSLSTTVQRTTINKNNKRHMWKKLARTKE